jgi:hypothetical protein
MKGHIRERSPGHWAIILDVPDPQTGQAPSEVAFIQGDEARGSDRERPVDIGSPNRHISGAIKDDFGRLSRPMAGSY